jgi:hypothetical protein
MAQTIKLKRSSQSGSSGIPTTNDLELGEVAINTYHGKMYIKRSNPNGLDIVEVNPDRKDPVVEDFHTFRLLNLTTSFQTLSFQNQYKATDYNSKHAVEAEVTVDVKYTDGASGFNIINDIEFYLQVRGQNGGVAIQRDSFTATHVAFVTLGGTSCHRISFEGNITKYIGDATAIATSSTATQYSVKTPLEYYYDPSANKTYVAYSTQYGSMFTSGTRTIYFSLEGFSTSTGTWRTLKTITLDQYGNDYVASLNRTETVKVKVGVTNQALDYRLQAREISTAGDNAQHVEHRVKITGVPV